MNYMRAVCLILVAAAVLFAACENNNEETAVDWLETTSSNLTDARALGQILCFEVDPFRYFFYSDYRERTNRLITEYQPGALFLSSNLDTLEYETRLEFNGSKLRNEIHTMQERADIPMLIAADFGNGAWYWDLSATRFPYPLALAASASPEMAYRQGKITAVEAQAQGINWLLSPLMNTVIAPDSISLTLQSFGTDSGTAASLGSQFIQGAQEAGVAATVKYLPDIEPLSLDGVLDEGDIDTIVPFRAGVETGVLSVMTSPIFMDFSADESPQFPATDVGTLLNDTLGFNGLVVSEFNTDGDTITVDATSNIFMEALNSGIDMFVIPEQDGSEKPFIDTLLSGVMDGRHEMGRIREAAHEILALKETLDLQTTAQTIVVNNLSGLGLPEYNQTAHRIAAEAITVLKNGEEIIPFTPDTYVVSFSFLDENSPQYATLYENSLEAITDSIKCINVFGRPDAQLKRELLRRAGDADVVLCSFFYESDEADRLGGLSTDIRNLMSDIIDVNDNIAVVSFHNPFLLNHIPAVKGYVNTYSLSEPSFSAVAEILFGRRPAVGTTPIPLSPDYPTGYGLETLKD